MVVEMIWEFMKIKIRPRDDNIMDQYSRLFMMRLLLFCAAVAGISWSTDQFHCVVPGKFKIIGNIVIIIITLFFVGKLITCP